MSELAQGLQLSVLGILITFASLGLLVLIMIVLRELFSAPGRSVSTGPKKEARADKVSDREVVRKRVAGIAVSIAYANKHRKHGDSNLGHLLESPPGRYWSDSRHA